MNYEHLFLYGGVGNNNCELKDIWLFSIKQEPWTELANMSEKLGSFSHRVWHSANATNTPEQVIFFGESSNFFMNPPETVKINNVAIIRFIPHKLKTLCLDIVLCIMKHDSETWMPCITELPRAIRYEINNRLAVQEQDLKKPAKTGKPG